ncbi:unnamed protein product, partial [Prorocentrum cordatum]
AILTGFVLSVALFLASSSAASPVSSVVVGDRVVSRTKRPFWEMQVLRREGHRILLLYLQGQLFFGSTSKLVTALAAASADDQVKYVILSLARVPHIDPSAARHLRTTSERLRQRGCQVIFCRMNRPVFETLTAAGVIKAPDGDLVGHLRNLRWKTVPMVDGKGMSRKASPSKSPSPPTSPVRGSVAALAGGPLGARAPPFVAPFGGDRAQATPPPPSGADSLPSPAASLDGRRAPAPDAFCHETDALDHCDSKIVSEFCYGSSEQLGRLEPYMRAYRAAVCGQGGLALPEWAFEDMNSLPRGLMARLRPHCTVLAELPAWTKVSDDVDLQGSLCFVLKGALSVIQIVPLSDDPTHIGSEVSGFSFRQGKRLLKRYPPGHVAGRDSFFLEYSGQTIDRELEPKITVSSKMGAPAEIWVLRPEEWAAMDVELKGPLTEMVCVQFADDVQHSRMQELEAFLQEWTQVFDSESQSLSPALQGRRRERWRGSRKSGLSALTLESPKEQAEECEDESNKGGGMSRPRMFNSEISRPSQTSLRSEPCGDRRMSLMSQTSVRHYTPFVAQKEGATQMTRNSPRNQTKARNAEVYRSQSEIDVATPSSVAAPFNEATPSTGRTDLTQTSILTRGLSSANLGVAPEHIRQQMMDIWAQERETHSRCVPTWLSEFVSSSAFGSSGYISGLLIMANALSIGVQADYMAREGTNKVPVAMRAVELFFCVAFTAELILRAMVDGRQFFSCASSKWMWNSFDTILVTMQIAEEMILFVMDTMHMGKGDQGFGSDFTIMRILRILRLIRIMRLVRVLRFIGELRTIVIQIIGSMRSLCWTCALLIMVMYVVGVYLTQLVSDYMVELRREDPQALEGDVMDLSMYFGSLGNTILSLYQAITNGISWYELSSPLMKYFSPWISTVLCFYTAFAIFALRTLSLVCLSSRLWMQRPKTRRLYCTIRCSLCGTKPAETKTSSPTNA